MDHSKRRRKVIRKLDFENYEITTVRMRKTYRKQSKALTIDEYEDEVSPNSESQKSSQNPCHETYVVTSPILYRKGYNQRRISETSSPVLLGKQRSALRKRFKIQDESESSILHSGELSSPVFKFDIGLNKVNGAKSCEIRKVNKSKPSCDIVTDDDYSADECVIEDFSQEPRRESNEEYKISDFSSESKVLSQIDISEDQSRETLSTEDEPFVLRTPTKAEVDVESEQEFDSGKKRKRHKKGGLVEKLLNLRKKQASERRIREHKKKIMKTEEIWKRNLHVVDAWKDGGRLTLKCQQMEVSQNGIVMKSAATDFLYMILNRGIGNCFKKIKLGSFLRIAAPWQEVRLHSLDATVLLSVTFIELIDSTPDVTIPQTELQEVSVTRYKQDEALLFDTIFASDENSLFR